MDAKLNSISASTQENVYLDKNSYVISYGSTDFTVQLQPGEKQIPLPVGSKIPSLIDFDVLWNGQMFISTPKKTVDQVAQWQAAKQTNDPIQMAITLAQILGLE